MSKFKSVTDEKFLEQLNQRMEEEYFGIEVLSSQRTQRNKTLSSALQSFNL